ncbi:transmembrane protein 138 [Oratosquilla oratoria]|uniref:transmembrane protein 138 n=1 Tax=Oratosquilla oratoria TaxID=337810 RepID=UPI003F76C8C4
MAWGSIVRYKWLSGAMVALLTVDLVINSVFLIFSHTKLIALLIYIIQDVCIVFSLILLFLAMFSTSFPQAGLVSELVHKFRWCCFVAVIYLALSLGFHSWSLKNQWKDPQTYIWSDVMIALFTLHRVVAGTHYYLYKRTILRLSDSSLYQVKPF